jgi:hypothetical protein
MNCCDETIGGVIIDKNVGNKQLSYVGTERGPEGGGRTVIKGALLGSETEA